MLPAVLDNQQVVADRTPVPDDTDGLTKTTVQKMGEYIRSSAADTLVQNCARYASGPMSRIFPHPAFGVFFFLKHRVRRVLDEGNMFRVGEPGAYDMLISPAVLLRMPNPAEDCDGFTMAASAMLEALGIPNCIVTVACDPREPQRWSHVFGMVQLPNGEWMPLDCSHANAPGQFPPGLQQRITRWQAWDLNGNPIDVAQPTRSYLRGYVPVRRRRRGVGQDDLSDLPLDTGGGDTLSLQTVTPIPSTPTISGSLGPLGGILCGDGTVTDANGVCGGAPAPTAPNIFGTTTPATSSTAGINWSALLAAGLTDATKVAQTAELPSGSSLTATGAVISSTLTTILPLLLLGVGAWLVISMMESAGKR
jgi:hypothetical protein